MRRDPLPRLYQSGTPLSDQAGGEGANAAPGHADPLIVETKNLGDAFGPGSSPPVEPEDGLAAPHSIPIAGGWSLVCDGENGPHYQDWFLCDPRGIWVAKFWDGPAAGLRDALAFAAAVAQAIEARRAETGTGSVHESAVGSADAPVITLGERRQPLVPASEPPAGGLSLSVSDQVQAPPDDNDSRGVKPWNERNALILPNGDAP